MGSNVPPITPTRRAVTGKGYRCLLLEPRNRRRAVAPPHHPDRLAHLSAGQRAPGPRAAAPPPPPRPPPLAPGRRGHGAGAGRHVRGGGGEPLVQLVHDLV